LKLHCESDVLSGRRIRRGVRLLRRSWGGIVSRLIADLLRYALERVNELQERLGIEAEEKQGQLLHGGDAGRRNAKLFEDLIELGQFLLLDGLRVVVCSIRAVGCGRRQKSVRGGSVRGGIRIGS
jgi:hypothetical protein